MSTSHPQAHRYSDDNFPYGHTTRGRRTGVPALIGFFACGLFAVGAVGFACATPYYGWRRSTGRETNR